MHGHSDELILPERTGREYEYEYMRTGREYEYEYSGDAWMSSSCPRAPAGSY